MSECACMIDMECDEFYPAFFRERWRKARKEHLCCECGRSIQRGETYEDATGKWIRGILGFKTCSDCLSLRLVMFCDSHTYGKVLEHIRLKIDETEGRVSSECILQLTPRAREWLLDEIQKYWDENPEEDEDERDETER